MFVCVCVCVCERERERERERESERERERERLVHPELDVMGDQGGGGKKMLVRPEVTLCV